MNYPHPLLAREGWPFIAGVLLLAILTWVFAGFGWSLPLWLAAIFVIQFFRNHGMMQILGRSPWRVIKGGSFRYVEKLTAGWTDSIRLKTPVRRVTRTADHVDITHG